MYDFNYHRAASLDDAMAKAKGVDDPMLMAGGMTVIPTMKQRLAMPSDVIDLGGIADLVGIEVSGDHVVIGAMTTHNAVATSADVQKAIPALTSLAEGIGDPAVRNRGTIGGAIANNDPAADYPGALVALGATIHTDHRTIEADDFFTGMFETALEPGEIITKVSFPIPQKAAYAKFPNPASRYAIVGAFVAVTGGGVRVAITGAGPTVYRATEMEKALSSNFSADAVKGMKADRDDLNGDIHASAEYRAHLTGVMVGRAVAAAG